MGLNEVKINRKKLLSSFYEETVNFTTVTVSFGAGRSIQICGKHTISDMNLALISLKAQGLLQTRIRDVNKVCHIVNESELQEIIAQGAVWGDKHWNRKVNLQEQVDAVAAQNYATEEAAIAAVEGIIWERRA